MLTSVHLLCGAGGDAQGLFEAGFTPVYAANHDPICIATHSRQFPCVHDLADVSQLQMTGLPGSDLLWASIICTEISPAGHRRTYTGPLEFDVQGRPIGSARFARTRATAFDFLRAVEVHRNRVAIIENVVEFATRWELFSWLIQAMVIFGYRAEVVSASAAHIGDGHNLAAPQLRDRIYVVFTRLDVPAPDLAVRPRSWCEGCRRHVRGVQAWRPAAARREIKVGKFGQQYDFRCPARTCGRVVRPQVRPALDVIDLSDTGRSLADRAATPRESTLARLHAALPYLSTDIVRRHHPGRPHRETNRRVAVLEYRNHCTAASGREPLSAISAQGNHHAFVFAPEGYRPGESLSIADLTYRIIKPTEQAAAQRFPASYTLLGTGTEQTRQAGNAVPVNVARWLGERLREVL